MRARERGGLVTDVGVSQSEQDHSGECEAVT